MVCAPLVQDKEIERSREAELIAHTMALIVAVCNIQAAANEALAASGEALDYVVSGLLKSRDPSVRNEVAKGLAALALAPRARQVIVQLLVANILQVCRLECQQRCCIGGCVWVWVCVCGVRVRPWMWG
jgi:hypothetical protein